MAKHIQTIRRQIANELFECVWPFCEIGSMQEMLRLNFINVYTFKYLLSP